MMSREENMEYKPKNKCKVNLEKPQKTFAEKIIFFIFSCIKKAAKSGFFNLSGKLKKEILYMNFSDFDHYIYVEYDLSNHSVSFTFSCHYATKGTDVKSIEKPKIEIMNSFIFTYYDIPKYFYGKTIKNRRIVKSIKKCKDEWFEHFVNLLRIKLSKNLSYICEGYKPYSYSMKRFKKLNEWMVEE